MSRFICSEVFDNQTQAVVTASSILEEMAISDAHKMRMVVEEAKQKGHARYSCPLCGRTLSLRGGLGTSFVMHFAHPREPEHHCPYKTLDNHTPKELEAMKYNGLKETYAHKQVKERLLRGLRHDPGVAPASLRTEEIFRANLPDKSWRRPDVAATWSSRNLVFEAQLATTFVTVIAERRNFYTENGAELVWIFAERPASGVMLFTVKDIFYNNNCNLFVVNSLTDAESIKQQKLILEAWWPDPSTYDRLGGITDWCSKLVSLEQLTFNSEKRIVFYFDFDTAMTERHQRAERRQIAVEQQQKIIPTIDDRVPPGTSAAFNFQYAPTRSPAPTEFEFDPDLEELAFAIGRRDTASIWRQLRKVVDGESRLDSVKVFTAFSRYKMITPIETFSEQRRAIHFEAILSALYSLNAGVPVGNGYANLKSIENWIFTSHTCHYLLFLRAVRTLRREASIGASDKTSTAGRHIADFKTARKTNDRTKIKFDQDRSLDGIFRLVFPELAADIDILASAQSKN